MDLDIWTYCMELAFSSSESFVLQSLSEKLWGTFCQVCVHLLSPTGTLWHLLLPSAIYHPWLRAHRTQKFGQPTLPGQVYWRESLYWVEGKLTHPCSRQTVVCPNNGMMKKFYLNNGKCIIFYSLFPCILLIFCALQVSYI